VEITRGRGDAVPALIGVRLPNPPLITRADVYARTFPRAGGYVTRTNVRNDNLNMNLLRARD